MTAAPMSCRFSIPTPRVPWFLAGLAAWLAVCLSAMPAPVRAQTPPPPRAVVRLAGSSAIGEVAVQELTSAWAKELQMPNVRVDLGADPSDYDVVAGDAVEKQRLRVQVSAKGTDSGLEPLLRGQADFWMTSRPARDSDIQAMRDRQVPNVPTLAQLRGPGVENAIGYGALAVVVNARNPVPMLSPAQIRDVYTGRASSWAQVGGPSNLPIGRYTLDRDQDTTDLFCRTFLGNPSARKCLDAFPLLTAPPMAAADDMADAVAGNPAGIGFLEFMSRRNARAIPLGNACGTGTEPSLFRIKAGEYPLVMPLYLYAAPNRPVSPMAQDFLRFALGPIGQAAIAAAGLTDLSPAISPPGYIKDRLNTAANAMDNGRSRVAPAEIQAFETATAGADRLSLTFRFPAGSFDLSARAQAEVTRLATLAQEPSFSRFSVVLVGYSSTVNDGGGDPALSERRANAIRNGLLFAGVTRVTAIGVGVAAPVACNADPATAMLNQRVEVWLRESG